MRKSYIILVSALIMSLVLPGTGFADETSDLILKLLVKKGVLTQEEVNELRNEARRMQPTLEESDTAGEREPNEFRVTWKDAVNFETGHADEESRITVKVGGRVQADAGWVNGSSDIDAISGESDTDAEFRRIWLYTSGTIHKNFIFKAQLGYEGGDVDLKDVYAGIKEIPYLGRFRVGHFQEPFSLDQLTSNKYSTFMERSLIDVFAPARNYGVALNSTAFGESMTWAVGAFRDTDDIGDIISNEYDVTTRFTVLPWYEDDEGGINKFLHIGAAYSFRNSDDTLQFAQRPEFNMEPNYTDTGIINADFSHLIGYELAAVHGPLSVQGEYMHHYVNQMDGASNTYFQGAYGQVSYFLTGEHRPYDRSTGTFTRVLPNRNFSFRDRTLGAWEVAGRFSYLDLSDGDIDGRIMYDYTAGINWYLNEYVKVMFNYIHSHVNTFGDADIFAARFQVAF